MTKARINRTKKYEEFVMNQVYEEIAKGTGCAKEDALTLLVNALAYNTVLAEIVDKAKMLTSDLVPGGVASQRIREETSSSALKATARPRQSRTWRRG